MTLCGSGWPAAYRYPNTLPLSPPKLSADPLGELPDGLHVLLCGAGGPLPDPKRSGPCALVIAGKQVVLVDVGDTVDVVVPSVVAAAGVVPAVAGALVVICVVGDSASSVTFGSSASERWANVLTGASVVGMDPAVRSAG